MRIVRYHEYGDPDVLRVEESEPPTAGPGRLLIEVEAVGVNYVQTQLRRGDAPLPSSLPGAPGGDVVGTVAGVGPGVEGYAEGDWVAAPVMTGAYADLVAVDVSTTVPLPDELDDGVASVLASPGWTASAVLTTARVEAGDTVLVHAASGVIGQLIVQLAKLRGAGTVVGTAGGAKLEVVRRRGADLAVDYADPSWPDEIRAAVGGVDVVADAVGGDVTAPSLDLLRPFGRMVRYGSIQEGAGSSQVSWDELFSMRYVTGMAYSAYQEARPDLAAADRRELYAYAEAGRLAVDVYASLPLERAADAHRILENREHTGRVLLRP